MSRWDLAGVVVGVLIIIYGLVRGYIVRVSEDENWCAEGDDRYGN